MDRTNNSRHRLPLADYVREVRAGNRAFLGRAITLVESRRPEDQQLARALLEALLPHAGRARRVGITGVPGVGKSSFIERLGQKLTASGHRVAVLAIDPSSTISGGSILGDKTRMAELSRDDNAFIRPSPSGAAPGGVARATREVLLLCEAAGFDVVLVETVGVGQGETLVAQMVDFLLVLTLAGAGDELQGIKRGILELADLVAVNKADGAGRQRAEIARRVYAESLRFFRQRDPPWRPTAVTCSALYDEGLHEIWQLVEQHRRELTAAGQLARKREQQQLDWMWATAEADLVEALHRDPAAQRLVAELEADVRAGRLLPGAAAQALLEVFRAAPGSR